MDSKVQKWENSCGVRIPASILKELGITVNDIISMKQEDNRIVIEKKEKRYHLMKEMLSLLKNALIKILTIF